MVEDYFTKHRPLTTYWIGLRQSYAPSGSGGRASGLLGPPPPAAAPRLVRPARCGQPCAAQPAPSARKA
jgi:hypothetical protein